MRAPPVRETREMERETMEGVHGDLEREATVQEALRLEAWAPPEDEAQKTVRLGAARAEVQAGMLRSLRSRLVIAAVGPDRQARRARRPLHHLRGATLRSVLCI